MADERKWQAMVLHLQQTAVDALSNAKAWAETPDLDAAVKYAEEGLLYLRVAQAEARAHGVKLEWKP